jgi:Polyketide cyclase / dehydrase and lipid transport
MIDAPPEAIIDTIADVGSLPLWSPVHSDIEVVDTYADGRPHHVNVTVKLMGIVDRELLEFHWGRDWVVWDAADTAAQHNQHVEFTLRPEAGRTRVRFDLTLEPKKLLPDFVLKRPREMVLITATEGLRKHVMARSGQR